MYKILLVDDEKRMLELLELFLEPHGYTCIQADSGEKALSIVREEAIDMVILDVMMPFMDGWETCRRIRERSSVPIIMLTARTEKVDVIKGLDVGADDYIIKPFDEGELVARVKALLRRVQNDIERLDIRWGEFVLDRESYMFRWRELGVHLTLKEYTIMETMISYPTRTYTREELLTIAWGDNATIDIRTVDSHIRNLREKLKKSGFPIDQFLKTVWGIGYRWS